MTSLGLSGPIARNVGGAWQHRRRIIYSTLVFCAICILYLLFFGKHDSRLHETIVNAAFVLAGGVIGSYVFGAVWDDKNFASLATSRGATESVSSSQPASPLAGGTHLVDDPDTI